MRSPLLIAVAVFLSAIPTFGQNAVNRKKSNDTFSPYLFLDFKPAVILFRSGLRKDAEFNYNVVTEEMVFNNKGKFIALEMPGIDTVFIDGKKFIPFDKIFYEVVSGSSAPIYIRHYVKLTSKGKPVGYGGYSQLSSTSSLINVEGEGGTFYKLEVPNEYRRQDKTALWIRMGGHFYEANNIRELRKAFPDKKNAIKKFVKEEKPDFNKQEDVVRLVQILE